MTDEPLDITPTERFMLLCVAWPKDKGRAYEVSGLRATFDGLMISNNADALVLQNWDRNSPGFQLRRIVDIHDRHCGYLFSEGNHKVTGGLQFLFEGAAFKLDCALAPSRLNEADLTMTLLGQMSEALRQPVTEIMRYARPGESVFSPSMLDLPETRPTPLSLAQPSLVPLSL